jgi:hypothetical protein
MLAVGSSMLGSKSIRIRLRDTIPRITTIRVTMTVKTGL